MTIKNGDLPAAPVDMTNDKLLQMMALGLNDASAKSAARAMMGLTKREQFAMAAMQGLLANEPDRQPFYIAADSVIMADTLLAELERTK